ncbi:MAG TPA: hypothetical protein DCR62_06710 [Acholeplasmatales bacterium]|jgi:hypothetical protein|nr:hypothetical protein [Bacilli bacterium]HAR58419.1 hypothetical protein [Acholeplasmatales bacterium]
MNNQSTQTYTRLKFEDNLSIIFIILNLLNIRANAIIENAILTGDISQISNALKIYRLIIVISILLYIYFVKRNYEFYIESKQKVNYDNTLEKIRLTGSVFILVGTILLGYTIFKEKTPEGEAEVA